MDTNDTACSSNEVVDTVATPNSDIADADKFNFRVVHDAFAESLKGTDDVELRGYIEAYKELYKFFRLLGTVFGFVAKDVMSKIEILEELRKDDEGEKFASVLSMIEHEKKENLLDKDGYVSGSRTLLRLHRGLEYIHLFLLKLKDLDCKDKTTYVCKDAYNTTLAKYHPWAIRKGALLAMYALPTKEVLFQRACNDTAEVQRALDVLPKMLEVSKEVYDRTQNLYAKDDLLDLP